MKNNSYHLLDSGNFKKLEQLGPYRLLRPSQGAIWSPRSAGGEWEAFDAKFERDRDEGGGIWSFEKNKKIPDSLVIKVKELKFLVKLTDFGHIGIFPEQAQNWKIIKDLVAQRARNGAKFEVLNLFGYTGGSTLAAIAGGASGVVHVDASKPTVMWARENAQINGFSERPIRWIVDDVKKFVARQERKGSRYHGIILDPPTYGRGSKGQVWKIENDLVNLLRKLKNLLADDFSFILLSSHTGSYTPKGLLNLLDDLCHDIRGKYRAEEMVITERDSKRCLPSGSSCFFIRA